MVDFTDGIDVVVGGAILASHTDNLADNTEFNRSWGDVEHNYDISTADGSHKDITFGADSTYDIAETAVRPAVVYSDKFDVLAGGEVSLDGGNGTYIKEITDDVIVLGIDSVNQTYFDDDKLNAAWDLDTDDGTLRVNWTGYQGGTTRYRDIVVYTGKSVPMTWWDGSANITYYYSDLNLAESLTVAQNKAIYLDTDKDTYFLAPTDDRIDYYVAGQQKLIIGSTYVQVINAELQLTGGDIILDVDGDSKLDNVSDDILAVVMGAGEVGRWDASGYNGVLGATTPAAATVTGLTVDSSGTTTDITVTDINDRSLIIRKATTANSVDFLTTSGADEIFLRAEESGTYLWFGTQNTERLRIDTDGNVGIGTSSPGVVGYNRTLEISKVDADAQVTALELTSRQDGTGDLSGLEYINNTTRVGAIIARSMNANKSTELAFLTHNGSVIGQKMVIDKDGNVGIGTASPSYKLDVVNSSSGAATSPMAVRNLGAEAVSGQVNLILQATDNDVIYTQLASVHTNATGGSRAEDFTISTYKQDGGGLTEKMRLDASGNLGLGVTPATMRSTDTGLQVGALNVLQGTTASAASGNFDIMQNAYVDTTPVYKNIVEDEASMFEQGGGAFYFYSIASQAPGTITWGTAKLTILNTGSIIQSATNAASSYALELQNDYDHTDGKGLRIQSGKDDQSATANIYIYCFDGNGDAVGYIENNSGTFQLVDVSDERLKTDVAPTVVKGIENLRQIEVVDFYREKDSDKQSRLCGFTAQQLYPLYPQAVSGDPNDKESILGVAKTELIAPLVKSVQELDGTMQTFMGRDLERKTELETLREKVEAQGKEIVELQEQLKRAA